MKKRAIIIIPALLCLLFNTADYVGAACTEFKYASCPSPIGNSCCRYTRDIAYYSDSCDLITEREYLSILLQGKGECDDEGYPHPDWRSSNDGSCIPADQGQSVGGCNSSTAYFEECSPVYYDADDFSTQFSDKDEWWYFTSTVSGGESYNYMSSYNNSGGTQDHRTSGHHLVDPAENTDCVSEKTFTALSNNSSDLAYSDCDQPLNAFNTGISTTYDDPDSTYACGYGAPGCNVVAEKKPDGDLGGEGSGCGAPVWSVNMVNMNLFVTDTPMWHDPPIGPSVKIQLSYNSQADIVSNAPFGNKWVFSYSNYLSEDSTSGVVTVYMPDGREDVYTPDGGTGYTNETGVLNVLTKTADNDFEVEFQYGTIYVYNRASTEDASQTLLNEIRDAYDQSLTLGYVVDTDRMDKITDAVNNDYTFLYGGDHLIDQVSDNFGRSVSFTYENNKLTKITDMGGYRAEFSYDENSYLTSITNNSGETWDFKIEPSDGIISGSNPYPAPDGPMGNNYRITVTDPLSKKEEYYYYGPYSWYISPGDHVVYTDADNNNYASAPKTIYYFNRGVGNGKIGRIVTPGGGRTDFRDFDPVSGKPGKIKDFHGNNVGSI